MKKKANNSKIIAIGRKLWIEGDRGAWNVLILVQLDNGKPPTGMPVRAHENAPLFVNTRDEARLLRDHVQQQLATGGSVFVLAGWNGDRPIVQKIDAANFKGAADAWRPPKSLQMFRRQAGQRPAAKRIGTLSSDSAST